MFSKEITFEQSPLPSGLCSDGACILVVFIFVRSGLEHVVKDEQVRAEISKSAFAMLGIDFRAATDKLERATFS
jgi:hypothetical protein